MVETDQTESRLGKGVTRRDFLRMVGSLPSGWAGSKLGDAFGNPERAVNSPELLREIKESYQRLRRVLDGMSVEQRRSQETLALTRAWLLFQGVRAVMLDKGCGLTARAMAEYLGGNGVMKIDKRMPEFGSAEWAVIGSLGNILSSAVAQGGKGRWLTLNNARKYLDDRRVGWLAVYREGVGDEAKQSYQSLLHGEGGRGFSHYFGQGEQTGAPPRATEDMAFLLGRDGLWDLSLNGGGELCTQAGVYPKSHMELRIDPGRLVSVGFESFFGARGNSFEGLELSSEQINVAMKDLMANVDEWSGVDGAAEMERAFAEGQGEFVEVCRGERFVRNADSGTDFPWGSWGSAIREVGEVFGVRGDYPVMMGAEMFTKLEQYGLVKPVSLHGEVSIDTALLGGLGKLKKDGGMWVRYEWLGGARQEYEASTVQT